jgi:tetratricopeptide (TPR) repeat protein
MNLNLIFYILIFLSLVGLGFIIYRRIPSLVRLSEEEMDIISRKKGVIERIREVDYKQQWLNFIIFLEKFLRRVKIMFLKIENILTRWIDRLRGSSQVMAQKSKEWIRQNELKRHKEKKTVDKEEKVLIKVDKKEESEKSEKSEISELVTEAMEEDDDLSLNELKKPIKEEQKWINLIIENPKNITAYKFLGLLYWKQHNYSDAKSSLETAIKYGSKDKRVKEVLEELKKMGVK